MSIGAGIRKLALGALAVASFFAAGSASAQVVTGTLGEPSATTTIKGNQIPAAPPPFGGVIKETLEGSKTWWPPRIVPPKGAPNILLIMTDDQGYGVPGTFGGVIPTPALDRIAKAGLRYIESTPRRCARRRGRR
jgi:Sulfatase